MSPSGYLVYTGAPNACGADSCEYEVTDGLATDSAFVTMSVTCANDKPIAYPASYTVEYFVGYWNNSLIATDVDSTIATYTIIQQPLEGRLSLFNSATGNFTYVPPVNYCGVDVFVFTVTDSDGATSTAEAISITVICNQPAVPNDQTIFISPGTATGMSPFSYLSFSQCHRAW
jgi:Big-like domain-containing protein